MFYIGGIWDIFSVPRQTFWDFLIAFVMSNRIIKRPSVLPLFGGGTNKTLDKHTYIEYNKHIPDLTNKNLFDRIWKFFV